MECVASSANCATLLKITGFGARLTGIDLGACTSLTKLTLQRAVVRADGVSDWYVPGKVPPACCANMVSLANLSVYFGEQEVCMDQFAVFPALTRLYLSHDQTSSLSGDVTGLSKLQVLIVTPAQTPDLPE